MDIRHLRLLCASLLTCSFLYAAPPVIVPSGRSVPGEVLVKFQAGASDAEVSAAGNGADVDHSQKLAAHKNGTVWRLHSRSLNTDALAAALQHNPKVVYAEPNYIVSISTAPNDPFYTSLWGLNNTGQYINGNYGYAGSDIAAEAAWTVITGSASIVVGVVDSGIDYTHPDLAANVWSNPGGKGNALCAAGTHGYNAITGTCDPKDDYSHGTHVSGTIGAIGNNNVGVTGVNWTSSIMGLKFIDSGGSGTTANAIAAIDFAVQAKIDGVNVRVLNSSWGGGAFSKALLDEINKAGDNDILFVASAGNDTANNDLYPHYPANYGTTNLISVAATDNRDFLAYFSDWGPTTVHLAAPGVNILSTTPNNTYQYFNGTSMAAPHVTGTAALILAHSPGLTTAQVKSAILNNVDPVSNLAGYVVTGGRLNAARAVGATLPASFTLSVSPAAQTVAQGSTTTYSVSVVPKDGFNGSVQLSATNLPFGVNATFSPSTTSTSSLMTLTASSTASTGGWTFQISGTTGSLTRTANATVTVSVAAPVLACGKFFQSAALYTSEYLTSIATGDFDRDGFADVVYLTQTNHVGIALSNHNGTFRSPSTMTETSVPAGVTVGDFNGDGKLDLAVANATSSNITVHLGNGDGTFGTGVTYSAGSSPFWIATGDFNGDGKIDLAVADNGSGSVSILIGQGDGTFAAPVSYAAASGPYWVSAGDFNNDGKQDLAVADFNANKISILLGNGNGTFQAAVNYSVGTGPSSIGVADFNRDGKVDLAVSNYTAGTVSILLGAGNGSFTVSAPFSAGSGPTALSVFDLNGDAIPDLLIAGTGTVNEWRGAGDGTFASVGSSVVGGPVALAVTDLDNDGRPDFVVADSAQTDFFAYLNGGTCTANCGSMAVSTAVSYSLSYSPQSVALGDFNGDGKLDIVTANSTPNNVSVALGNGDGTFPVPSDYSAGTTPRFVKIADVNGDGKLDLIVADSGSDQVSILRGNGDGTFQGATGFATGTAPHSVTAGDFNGDGKVDLAVANSGSANVSRLLGNGDGSFQAAVNYGAGTTPELVASADINRDGRLDLVVANSGSNDVSVLLGNGDGTFQAATNYAVGTTPLSLWIADFNRDGKLDLAVANSGSGNVSVLLGNGSGGFAAAMNYTAGTAPDSITAGDFNKDGLIDLGVALNNGSAAILPGSGNGSFGSPALLATGSNPSAIATGDINRDGSLDLVVANSGSNTVSLLRNTCPIPDLVPAVVHNGSFTQGDTGKTYTITVTNSGVTGTTAAVSVADTLPLGIAATAVSGSGWTCTLAPLACNRSDSLAAGASFPTITVTVNVGDSAASATNTVTVSGGGELNTLNDTASDTVSVAAATDLTIALNHTASFAQGATGRTYSISVKNAGRAATSGQITVTDALPTGLTATAMTGTGWACNVASLTCTRSDSLVAGTQAPLITLTVNVDANAPVQVVNSATVSGGGESVTNNDTATDPTTIWRNQTCGTLGAPTSYNAGQYPYGLAKGDFNHDGKIDLVAANNYNNNISVMLGTAGGFAAPVSYTVTGTPMLIVTADLNGDGNVDLVTSSYFGSIAVLLGNGDGTFAAAVNYPIPNTYLSGLAIADLNGDGNQDVTVATQAGSVQIFLGNGNGTLQNATSTQPGQSLTGIVAGDFDGDGKVDIVTSDYYTYNLMFQKGNGDGTFQAAILYNVGYYPTGVYAADFNGDGKLDLAAPRSSYSTVAVLLGNGDGTFQTSINYAVYSTGQIAIDDVNGDGKLDIVELASSYLSILYGNGDGTFQPYTYFYTNIYGAGLVIADFNGDGGADVAITNDNYSGTVVVLRGACPDLTITKTHVGNFTAGGVGSYTLTVSDVGGATTGLVAVTEMLPDGLSLTNMSGAGWTCDLPTARCTINQPIAGGGSFYPITVTVNVSKTAPSGVVNQATVSTASDSNSSNNVASDGTTIIKAPDLTVSKTHDASFAVGQSGRTYTITVSNSGAAATTGTVTANDLLPTGLTGTGISGSGWSCTLLSLTCTRSDSLAAGSAYPPIIVTVNVAANAASAYNVATVSGGGEGNTSNDSASDYTVILAAPTNVVATAVLSTQVSVAWNPVPGAGGYQVFRSTNNVNFALLGNAPSTSYLDTTAVANTPYFYEVRAIDATATGPLSVSDLAMTVFFSNDPITPGATPIRSTHILELRSAINILRATAGLSAATFTDASLSGKPVKAVHFTELQTALNQARGALLLPAIVYSVQTPASGNPVYGSLIRDLRIGLQ